MNERFYPLNRDPGFTVIRGLNKLKKACEGGPQIYRSEIVHEGQLMIRYCWRGDKTRT